MGRTILAWLIVGLCSSLTVAQHHALENAVQARVTEILDEAESSGDLVVAMNQAHRLFDQVVAWAKLHETEAFRQAAFTCRLIDQLVRAEQVDGLSMLHFLRTNARLAAALVFLIGPGDKPAEVYGLLNRLRGKYGDTLDDYASLAAAVCVVHDRKISRRINENLVAAGDPLEIFSYFRRNERKMLFGVRDVPAELLVYIVDSTSPINEMQWALSEYSGHKKIGSEFHNIEYDLHHFQFGSPKKVTEAGFTLPNIKRYGGVCADQAYFAVAVGKAIGVPTAYTVGRGSNVGHAWVGYFQSRGESSGWNFSEGRYAVYRGVRGVTINPQTGGMIDDSRVSLLGELIGSGAIDRHTANAMIDAAGRLLEIRRTGEAWSPLPLVSAKARGKPRAIKSAATLNLIETGLRRCMGHADGWQVVADMAAQGELTFVQKRRWADLVMKLCGKRYPDFAVAILYPMIRTLQDVKQQNAVWEAAYKKFVHRADLAAEIRMAQGDGWRVAGHPKKAGRCYHDVIMRFANVGPFVIHALEQTEKMLIASGKPDRVLELYRDAWSKINPPEKMAQTFMVQSNWYQVASRYADRLRQSGRQTAADEVEKKIQEQTGVVPGS